MPKTKPTKENKKVMLNHLQKLREEREEGFTLIELLVVILIIGILSAIAIPAFMNQKKSAIDSSVQADLKTVAQEIATYEVKASGTDLKVNVVTANKSGVTTIKFGPTATPTYIANVNLSSKNTNIFGGGSSPSNHVILGTNPDGDRSAASFAWASAGGGPQW